MRIVGLDHVQIAIPEDGLAAARAFYGTLLGLEEEPRPSGRSAGIWYRAPGTVLHLGVEPGFAPARKAHPAFLVEDLAAARAALAAAGFAPTAAEGPRFHVHDPFGNRIELLQRGRGFSER